MREGVKRTPLGASVKLKTPMGNQVHHFLAPHSEVSSSERDFCIFMAYHFGTEGSFLVATEEIGH